MRESHFSDGVARKVMDGFFSILLVSGRAGEQFDHVVVQVPVQQTLKTPSELWVVDLSPS